MKVPKCPVCEGKEEYVDMVTAGKYIIFQCGSCFTSWSSENE